MQELQIMLRNIQSVGVRSNGVEQVPPEFDRF